MKTHWKVLTGLLAVVLPPLLTYLAAHSEANEASIRAEVAYSMWQEAVKELQDESYRHALAISEIQGQLKAERRFASECRQVASLAPAKPSPSPKPEPEMSSDADGIPDRPTKPRMKAQNFEDAVQSFKAKK